MGHWSWRIGIEHIFRFVHPDVECECFREVLRAQTLCIGHSAIQQKRHVSHVSLRINWIPAFHNAIYNMFIILSTFSCLLILTNYHPKSSYAEQSNTPNDQLRIEKGKLFSVIAFHKAIYNIFFILSIFPMP